MVIAGRNAVLPAGQATLAVKELTFPDPAAGNVFTWAPRAIAATRRGHLG